MILLTKFCDFFDHNIFFYSLGLLDAGMRFDCLCKFQFSVHASE